MKNTKISITEDRRIKNFFHTLRHNFATQLLEGGTDLRHIQELFGHKSSKTTEIYTYVNNTALSRIKSPLDTLNFKEGGGQCGKSAAKKEFLLVFS